MNSVVELERIILKSEPSSQVAPSRAKSSPIRNYAQQLAEVAGLLSGPGMRKDTWRGAYALPPLKDKGAALADVPNPNAPDGRWDPFAFMPSFVFDAAEDAFPVAPNFDGDGNIYNNASETWGGHGGSYQDGVIGGEQSLSGAFAAARQGRYTVLTYNFYMAHNKGANYHNGDYATAQVYMAPDAKGKLAPAYLLTSWHRGGVLTPWEDLAKDMQGRPVIKVQLGSHALQPVEAGKSLPEGGLTIRGDGSTTYGDEPTPFRLNLDTFQHNVQHARVLDLAEPSGATRLSTMRWGEVALKPLSPEAFMATKPWRESWDRLRAMTAGAVDKVQSWF